ncbi:MAG: carboxypeptidase-like regulatory domain-containing protein [Flammeovirgaceae bacterium]
MKPIHIVSLILFTFHVVAATPTQIFNTSLTITVRDEIGNTVQGASILLFETEENYKNEKNHIAEGTTNAQGVFKFKKLKPIPYFVLVKKNDKDNANGGEKISQLEEGKFNKVTIVIQ